MHTYALPALAPLAAHTHARMQTQSFYVRLAASPCGRWLACGSGGGGRGGGGRRRWGVGLGLDRLELCTEGGCGLGAADAWPVDVLEGDGGGVEARELGRLGAVLGERDADGGVVDHEAGGDVLVQELQVGVSG